MNQITPLLSLYSEIIACLIIVSLLSLIVGWMLRRSRAKRQMNALTQFWEKRYNALEDMSRLDIENLEEQLQGMANETKIIQATNRLQSDSLKANDSSAQKYRAEAIELNRQHAEAQERLQRIIQQKDRDIVELGNQLSRSRSTASKAGSVAMRSFSSAADDTDALGDGELTYADTVAIGSADLLDSTIQMSPQELRVRRTDKQTDDELESTVVINHSDVIDMEEATVALDEESLAFARRSSKSNRKN
ncbi:hypothetical protein [Granulosicoccus antarcticus]|nr:hypothetical protein [Granulosicoccus antarcticus]